MKEFNSLRDFARHLRRVAARTPAAVERITEKMATGIELEAKAELGTYQSEAYPFDAWAPLAESTKQDRVRKGYTPDDPGLRSGEMRDSIGHLTDRDQAVIGSRSDHLVWFEQGTRNQPPRSVLGLSAVRYKAKALPIIQAELQRLFR